LPKNTPRTQFSDEKARMPAVIRKVSIGTIEKIKKNVTKTHKYVHQYQYLEYGLSFDTQLHISSEKKCLTFPFTVKNIFLPPTGTE
jgi:hypothetical protein